MTQLVHPETVTATIASQVRRCRRERKMSAQRLADGCAELGMPIPRSVLANLESGRRDSVSVAELIVLAQALDVSPVDLLFSSDAEADVVRWFMGALSPGMPSLATLYVMQAAITAFQRTLEAQNDALGQILALRASLT